MQSIFKHWWSKLLVIAAIFAVSAIAVAVSDIPASYVTCRLQLNDINDSEIVSLEFIDNDMGEREVYEALVEDSVVEFSIDNDYDEYDHVNIIISDADGIVKCEAVDILSRDKVIDTLKASEMADNFIVYDTTVLKNEKDAIVLSDNDYEINISFSGEYLEQFKDTLDNDWKLKSEIVLTFAVITGVIAFLYSEICLLCNNKKNRRNALIILLLAACAGCCMTIYIKLPETYYRIKNNISPAELAGYITDEEAYYQSFRADKEIQKIGIRFATYNNDISGGYELRVYSNADNTLVSTGEINGSELINDAYYWITLDEPLEQDIEYKFTVVCVNYDELPQADTISYWRSGRDEYAEGALYVYDTETDYDINFELQVEGPKTCLYIMAFVMIIFIISLVALIYDFRGRDNKKLIILIYAGVFILCALKMSYYVQNMFLGTYDEMAHISYIAYMQQSGKIIPEFENATLLMPYGNALLEDPYNVYALDQRWGIFSGKFSGTVNYLGHPPLYYWLMKMTQSVHTAGDLVEVNLTRLRAVNMVMVLSAIIIMFYIGFRYLKTKNATHHLLYAVLCTSVPLLCFEAVTISNDNLLVFTVAVFMLGAVRFIENKKDFLTYLMIAGGICGSMLTKTTGGLMLLITTVIFVVWNEIKDKTIKDVFNLRLLGTIPVYVVTALYFIYMKYIYGTFQPSLSGYAYEQYIHYPNVYVDVADRTRLEFWDFIKSFLNTFLVQWVNGVSWNTGKDDMIAQAGNYIFILLFILPIILLLFGKKKNKKEILFASMSISMLITIALQFSRAFKDFQFVSGHGGMQSRYYLCITVFFAMVFVYVAELAADRLRKYSFVSNTGQCIFNAGKILIILEILIIWIVYYSELIMLALNETVLGGKY